MDMGLREWLILIGVIVIGAIAVDGYRRVRGGKKGLRLNNPMAGLARSQQEKPAAAAQSQSSAPQPSTLQQAAQPQPRQADVPPAAPAQLTPSVTAAAAAAVATSSGTPSNDPRCMPFRTDVQLKPKSRPQPAQPQAAAFASQPKPQPQPPKLEPMDPQENIRSVPVQEVLVINVMSLDPQGFDGRLLMHNILDSGLRFGDMDIFHRHESMAGTGEVIFSMANGVKPGYFDLDYMQESFRTPAVSFFMMLPGPRNHRQSFDLMVASARRLAHDLQGELRDEQRNPMTAASYESYRQRITEFERLSGR